MTTDPAVLFFEVVADQFEAQMETYVQADLKHNFLDKNSEPSWKPHIAKAIPMLNQNVGTSWIDLWEQSSMKRETNQSRSDSADHNGYGRKTDLELYVGGEVFGIELKCLMSGEDHWMDAQRLLLSNKYDRRFLLLAGPTTGPFKSVHDAQGHLLRTEHWDQILSQKKESPSYRKIIDDWQRKGYPLPPQVSSTMIGERPIGSSAAVGLIEITI